MTVTVLNGQLPASMLVTVGTDAYGRPAQFQPHAAASWNRMRAAGMPHDVSDTYRDLARQWDYYLDPPNSAGLAAYPGTSSHGEGLAVDARGKCLAWLAEHGKAHGWIRTIAKEPWHFVYHPGRDQYVGAGGGATTTPPEEDDMPYSPDELMNLMRAVRDEEGGDSHSAVVKLARHDPQVVLFRTADNRRGVAWPGRGYAIAPDDETADGFVDVLSKTGRSPSSLAVARWSAKDGTDVVNHPERFGPRIAWDRYAPSA